MADTTEIVPVPYTFTHGQKRSILAFVADPKLQEEALAAGAEFALGPEIVKKVFFIIPINGNNDSGITALNISYSIAFRL